MLYKGNEILSVAALCDVITTSEYTESIEQYIIIETQYFSQYYNVHVPCQVTSVM